jgi:UDP:flavonoid glycosyltransferase YjiC (YdhE family)
MDLTLLALGSRGDVQPAIALALGLSRAGHRPLLATYQRFRSLVASHGVPFHPIEGDVEEVIASEEGRRMMESGKNDPLRLFRLLRDTLRPVAERNVHDTIEACKGADGMVTFGPLFVGGECMREKYGLPYVRVGLQPITTPTRAFPSSLSPFPSSTIGAVNLASYTLTWQVFWQMMRPIFNGVSRKAMGLPPWPFTGPLAAIERAGVPSIYAFSPTVLPRPADWPAHAHVTGFLLSERPADFIPSPELSAFLASGPPPVYVGFGSMANRDPARTTALVLDALAIAGQRGVLVTGWGALQQTDLPDSVFMLDSAPHDWLFPQMAAVVHHGGAGTTAAGLCAGVPSILVPHFTDQPFWARRVQSLGVGPRPIPRRKLSATRLAEAIEEAVRDRGMRERAAALGKVIRGEDGVGRAVERIVEYFRSKGRA